MIENELDLLVPAVRRDRAAVEVLPDRQFREFGASGRVWDRDGVLVLLADDDAPPPVVGGMTAVRLGPDVVLLTYHTRARTGRAAQVGLPPPRRRPVADRLPPGDITS